MREILEKGKLPDGAWLNYAMRCREDALYENDLTFVESIERTMMKAGWRVKYPRHPMGWQIEEVKL